ncbi:YlaI family protein [Alkalibacillus haloalkaliphilus]|uniref:YlaI family protein n=1 Tax=Alkalibacillus haloalkaliphilus TaxID=94136 RepID=UPI00293687A1|nr:YlaI family protein [Alkalibacillus haloalkaliphilus]MDV2582272.1 YlaI family protein [Alkalibacillus haloalkaliphilus]
MKLLRAKCILCDRVDKIEAYSLLAKQLRKKRKMSYLCDECSERISDKTHERKQSANFNLYKEEQTEDYIR